ncbi:hypothetical protein TNCV_2145711 [Trichonephila clavipes]|uniref:Uncharacterized protein n=1 Tax=Trichonephila clavipes TaxID=2585209 RepID=A0A8X6T6K8_TRICX|nr:hypothetical protein TNCV_2145711 [Trichonephila clavipes]
MRDRKCSLAMTFESINGNERARKCNIWFIYVTAINYSIHIFIEIHNIEFLISVQDILFYKEGDISTVLVVVFSRNPLSTPWSREEGSFEHLELHSEFQARMLVFFKVIGCGDVSRQDPAICRGADVQRNEMLSYPQKEACFHTKTSHGTDSSLYGSPSAHRFHWKPFLKPANEIIE